LHSHFRCLFQTLLKKYETGVGTDEPAKQVWLRGPFPCGEQADITIFRGGDEDTAIEDRDKNALYFQIPEKKKVAGDSAYTGEPERVICTMPEMKRKDIGLRLSHNCSLLISFTFPLFTSLSRKVQASCSSQK